MFHISVFCEATQQTAHFVFDRVAIEYHGMPGASVMQATINAKDGWSAQSPAEARQALVDDFYDTKRENGEVFDDDGAY